MESFGHGAGETVHGFMVERVTGLPSQGAEAVQARHLSSGAGFLHLRTDDDENFFAAAFRTPPPDDTGLPHILEHAVLSGSARFPVRDPFVVLLRTSMATFMNAFTFPDRTVYPVASRNPRDFRNLVEVYCDALWNPRLDRFAFMQEGHHLDFAEPGDTGSPLVVSGIVYNEMKGAYSDPENVIEENLSRTLFPDTIYGRDAGGDPDRIPDLTYGEFLAFHRDFYHPSNCRIFLYGGLPTEEHMRFLDGEYLGGFTIAAPDTYPGVQPRWSTPRSFIIPMPADGQEGIERWAAVSGWLTCGVGDTSRVLAMRLLEDCLVGNDASPLRKALVESGLGMGMVCTGFDYHRLETVFSAGLRGTGSREAGQVHGLITDVLAGQAENGIDRNALEAGLHRLELSSAEVGRIWPLSLMDRVFRSWIYDLDPLQWLRTGEQLSGLRRTIDCQPGFMEEILSGELCSNPHRVDLTFRPDPGLFSRREAELESRLEARKAGMDAAELELLAQDAASLSEYQTGPDTDEALASLPVLGLHDVPRKQSGPRTAVSHVGGIPLLRTDVFSNGLCHLELSLGIGGLDAELLPLVPLYCDAVLGMGTSSESWEDIALREASCCAGISAMPTSSCTGTDASLSVPVIRFSSRCLDRNVPAMLGVMSDRLLGCDLSDTGRLSDMVKEEAVDAESSVIARGLNYAVLASAGKVRESAALRELFEGVSSLRLFTGLAAREVPGAETMDGLERIRAFVLGGTDLACSVVCGPGSIRPVEDFLAGLPVRAGNTPGEGMTGGFAGEPGTVQGLAVAASVSYTGFTVPCVPLTHRSAPALRFLARQLHYGYLWDEIRARRGAYGVSVYLGTDTGTFSLGSFRDPCMLETLGTFRGLPAYVREEMDLGREAMESGIISALKDLDPPSRPGPAVRSALDRFLAGIGLPDLAAHREGLLDLTPGDVLRTVSEVLEPVWDHASVCLVAGREMLEESADSLGGMVISSLGPDGS